MKPICDMTHTSAVISDCGRYRYRLDRSWGEGPHCTFLMLNPSTADDKQDDHTIRKCIGFAFKWNFMGIRVVNLFALRARNPDELLKHEDPVGPGYDRHFRDVLNNTSVVIAAWGCGSTLRKSPYLQARPDAVLKRVRQAKPWMPIECLGIGKQGVPYHPLMLSYDTARISFPVGVPIAQVREEGTFDGRA